MDPSHDDLITQFCGITGSSPATAQTALASTNWNLNEAVTFFFASQDQPAAAEDMNDDDEQPQQSAPSSVPQPAQPPSTRPARPPPNQSRLRTLRDLQGSAAGDSDDEEENRQDFFAGGEKSGLAVQNPNNPSGPSGSSDHFNNIINQAQQNRPRPGGEDEPVRSSHFTGRAQTLGGDDEPSRVLGDPTSSAPRPASLPRVERVLHLWQDGFSVDDGPLYRFDDPANAPTLALINQGRAPLALLGVQPGQEVDLSLTPHKDEKYVKPKTSYKPFGGSGQRLGSPTPGASGSAPINAQPATAPAPAATASSSSAAAPTVDVDESQPTVTLQIRLGDGTRLQSRFNTTHTIGDVYGFVNSANTASGARAYALMTTFPSKELSDKSAVLGDMAEFKRGGVVVQKWT